MGFDNRYPNRKDWRKPYDLHRPYDKRAIDPDCRPHGGCPYCLSSRFYRDNKSIERMDQDMKDFTCYPSTRSRYETQLPVPIASARSGH